MISDEAVEKAFELTKDVDYLEEQTTDDEELSDDLFCLSRQR